MFADHLDKKICTPDVSKVANRDGYGAGLKEAGEQNKNVVALCADLQSQPALTSLLKRSLNGLYK